MLYAKHVFRNVLEIRFFFLFCVKYFDVGTDQFQRTIIGRAKERFQIKQLWQKLRRIKNYYLIICNWVLLKPKTTVSPVSNPKEAEWKDYDFQSSILCTKWGGMNFPTVLRIEKCVQKYPFGIVNLLCRL